MNKDFKKNELGNYVIALKNYKFISINHLLVDFLKSNSHTSNLPTYYVNQDNTVSETMQCERRRYRSMNDIYSLCKYYKEDVTIEEIFKSLLTIFVSINDYTQKKVSFLLGYCRDINNIRFMNHYPVKIETLYHHAIIRNKGISNWTWEELFKKININSLKDLNEFYEKHFNIETIK